MKAIKNRQFMPWPGLTAKAVSKHFPESEEIFKGCGGKTRSGLLSTKMGPSHDNNDTGDEKAKTTHIPWSTAKECTIFKCNYNLEDKAQLLHQLDQAIPNKIEPRLSEHHGVDRNRQQCYYPDESHDKQDIY
jgi:hypothetical protein